MPHDHTRDDPDPSPTSERPANGQEGPQNVLAEIWERRAQSMEDLLLRAISLLGGHEYEPRVMLDLCRRYAVDCSLAQSALDRAHDRIRELCEREKGGAQ
jgi:hypothetical protein